ncbi:MAG: site-specific DNA-methyltransferase [Betaproteobacteria bacterium]|nr:site-specific DNA-methyltransferase [Betaproteobacteria bacterium]
MQKLKMRSLDLVCDNVARIRELFPHCVTEAHDAGGEVTLKVDFDLLRQELSDELVEGPQERYRLDWPGKREAYAAANAPIAKSLRPCREESVDFDATENLYIEGDNLEVLKLLQESYLGKVKMIYIDPPYNTGNDFIYKDNFTEDAREFLHRNGQYDDDGNRMKQNLESDGRFHSNWLSMIYPRLRIARNLLADDGLILLNIDENEITNMQKICELIFGEPNDLGTIVWDKRNPKGDSRGVSYQHECIIVFSRNKETLLANCKMLRPKKNAELMLKKAEQLFKKIDSNFTLKEINKEFQAWITMQKDFSSGEAAYKFIDNNGDVYRPVSMAWPNNKKAPDDYFIPLIHPTTHKACPVPQKGWRNPSVTMRKLQESGLIIFGKDESIQPNRKYLLKENMDENISSLLYYGGSDTDMLAEMEVPFDTPKVVAIVKEHINSFTKPDDIILDFFSGSATTAHAVMQLNAEDGGNRKFIMAQWPEICPPGSEAAKAGYKNICEIGKERIRRAAKKIMEENPLATQDLDIGFRVLKVKPSCMADVYYAPDETKQQELGLSDNIRDDVTPEDLLFQVLIDWGVELHLPVITGSIKGKKVFFVDDTRLAACFDNGINDEFIKELASHKPARVVFRDSGFADDAARINAEQIFRQLSPTTEVRVL